MSAVSVRAVSTRPYGPTRPTVSVGADVGGQCRRAVSTRPTRPTRPWRSVSTRPLSRPPRWLRLLTPARPSNRRATPHPPKNATIYIQCRYSVAKCRGFTTGGFQGELRGISRVSDKSCSRRLTRCVEPVSVEGLFSFYARRTQRKGIRDHTRGCHLSRCTEKFTITTDHVAIHSRAC